MPEVISSFVKAAPGYITLRGMPVDRIASTVIGGDADLGLGYYLLPNSGLQPL